MPTHDQDAPTPVETAPVELDEASIAAVAGGLNPQPLPPGRAMRLD
jgi:hypothetical protein